jgi:hypothetical protein
MSRYIFFLSFFILLYSAEEIAALLVRKKEAAVEGCKRREANRAAEAGLLESFKPKRNKFWNANVGVDGLRGLYPACVVELQ